MTPPIFAPLARGRFLRRCRRRGLEPRADPLFESGEAVHVKGFDQLFLEITKKRERIIIHPSKKHDYGLVPVDVRRATGLNPSTDNVASKLSKIATRIVEFVGLGGTAGKECFVKLASAPGVALDELFDPGCDRLQPTYEREALTIADEGARFERSLDIPLDWVHLSHRVLFEFATMLRSRVQSPILPRRVMFMPFSVRADWRGRLPEGCHSRPVRRPYRTARRARWRS